MRRGGVELVIAAAVILGFEPRVQAASSDLRPNYERAQDALAKGRLDEARIGFAEVLRLAPTFAEAHASLGLVYYRQLNFAKAATSFQEAIRLKPSLAIAETFLGLSQARGGHPREARVVLEKAVEHCPDQQLLKQAEMQLLEVYSALGETGRALPLAVKLQKAYPADAEVLYSCYRLFSTLGSQAVSQLAKSNPDSARLHQVTAELMETEGDFAHAVEQYRMALKRSPDTPGLHRALGVAMLSLSRDSASLAAAQKEFEEELAANPGDPYSEYQLGEIYIANNQWSEARQHLTVAVDGNPAFVDAQIALGKVLIAQGKYEDAKNCLERALEIEPDNEAAHYRLAHVYGKLGDKSRAAEELAKFNKLREASAAIGSIYRQVQRRQEAIPNETPN